MFPKNPQMETLLNEIRLFLSRIGTLRSILLHLALLAAFGIWIPRLKGLDFLDTQVLAAYVCLGLIFAAPATAQAFPEAFSTSFQQAKARIFVSVLYGEIVVLALLGAGIATVYLTNRGGFVPSPDWETLAKCAIFGLGASAMLASLAAWTTLRFSRRVAMICLRLAFFGLLILFFYRGQRLPDVGLTAAAACLVVTGLAIELLRRACR
jgi:hypothetical protein